MADRERVRKSIESALIDLEDLPVPKDEIAVSWQIASYTAPEGKVTTENILFGTGCSDSDLLDVAGLGVTGSDGQVELSLNEFHCLDVPARAGGNTLGYKSPVNVVATSRASQPVHLAARARVGEGSNGRPQDVFITVSSWDTNGDPVGRIPFHWRCQVPIEEVVG